MSSSRAKRFVLIFISVVIVLIIIIGKTLIRPSSSKSSEFSSTEDLELEIDSNANSIAKSGGRASDLSISVLKSHSAPIVIANCLGRPGFKMSLPNYPHLKHWLSDAISNTPINIGPDYLRYQDMFLSKRFGSQAIMIDVGCNHGLAALPVAALGHKVVCFEPVKYNYEKLVQSQIFNTFKNPMTIVNAALGERSSNVSIYVPTLRDDNASLNPRASISNLPNSKYTKEIVEMITLDDFLDQNSDIHPSKIEFVKVDVQGFEEFVMKGSVRFLRRANSKIIIECEFSPKMIQARGGHPIQLLAFMHDQGYHFTWNGNSQTPDNFVSFIQSIGDSQVDIEFFPKK